MALRRQFPGIELAGYLDAAVGVGEAARRYLGALRSVNVAVRARDVRLEGRDSAMTDVHWGGRFGLRGARFNVLCLNPEQLLPYLASPGAPRQRGRLSVAAWSWEVDVLPAGWREASRRVDAIWACSEFTARQIAAGTDAPVVAMPHPLANGSSAVARSPDLPAGYRILVMFDYLSTIQRKNPVGAIEAYRSAFAPDDGVQLIVKSINGVHRSEHRSDVERAASGRQDIQLLDGTISGAQRDALMASCDCFLSLHRSEGFGLSLADAMAAGKPVIATAYGGNTEFMDAATAYLVPYRLTQVGPGCEHYPAEATWAEPDLAHAAAALRSVYEDREESTRRGAAGQAAVHRLLAPETIGRRMLESLAAVAGDAVL